MPKSPKMPTKTSNNKIGIVKKSSGKEARPSVDSASANVMVKADKSTKKKHLKQ